MKKAGAEANAVNLTRAQPIYLRALGAALLAAGDRYGDAVVSELDFAALIEEVRNASSDGAVGPADAPTPSLDHGRLPEVLAADVPPEGTTLANLEATVEAAAVGTPSTIAFVSAALDRGNPVACSNARAKAWRPPGRYAQPASDLLGPVKRIERGSNDAVSPSPNYLQCVAAETPVLHLQRMQG